MMTYTTNWNNWYSCKLLVSAYLCSFWFLPAVCSGDDLHPWSERGEVALLKPQLSYLLISLTALSIVYKMDFSKLFALVHPNNFSCPIIFSYIIHVKCSQCRSCYHGWLQWQRLAHLIGWPITCLTVLICSFPPGSGNFKLKSFECFHNLFSSS